jgi:cell division protein FtsI/penicillin-binding protein 2
MALTIQITPEAKAHIAAKSGTATVYMDSSSCGGG